MGLPGRTIADEGGGGGACGPGEALGKVRALGALVTRHESSLYFLSYKIS